MADSLSRFGVSEPHGVLTFRAVRPAARFAPLVGSWTQVRVDFHEKVLNVTDAPRLTDTGWQLGTPVDLERPDRDAAEPEPRDISVIGQGNGWYRVVFVDADGNIDPSRPAVEYWTGIAWRPTAADVAAVMQTYTRSRVDEPGEYSGREQAVFTDTTSPTISLVNSLINQAIDEIAGQTILTAEGLNDYADLAKQTATWWVAATIDADKASAQAMDAEAPPQWKLARHLTLLKQLQATIPTAVRLA